MKPEDDRCEEHGMYLYRTGFGWSCKLGCYYTDDPQKIKDGFITQYKKELEKKIYNIFLTKKDSSELKHIVDFRKEILELLK